MAHGIFTTLLAVWVCVASGQSSYPASVTPQISLAKPNVLPTSAFKEAKTANPKATSSVYSAFEVYAPVLNVDKSRQLVASNADPGAAEDVVASGVKSCQQTLVVHSFQNSYGNPYTGVYRPPSCSFNQVTWNLTVETSGIQYDRMGSVSLGSIEVFRTSTVEPDVNITKWTYLKNMSPYVNLFKYPAPLIFDLPNIIENTPTVNITGPYNVTLTATYFTIETAYEPADSIFTISQDLGGEGQASYFTFPQQNASSSISLPENMIKAVYTVVAVGQGLDEEFWWASYLNSETNTFPDAPSGGFSPFREVQLFIDGRLAGVAWPFPILFSGADDPSLWRPIGGIDILDLKEYEIDITPWLPLLCNGKNHTFTMVVSGINNTGTGNPAVLSETTDQDWFLGGKIFVWTDQTSSKRTTGTGPIVKGLEPTLDVSSKVTQNSRHRNASLEFTVSAARSLSFQSTLELSTGKKDVFWSQQLSYSAKGRVSNKGYNEQLNLLTTGYEVSSSGYARKFGYPFYVGTNATYLQFLRGKDVDIMGPAVFPTGVETFYPNDASKGSSSAVEQNAIYNNGSISANTHLLLSAIEMKGSPGWSGWPAVTSNQTLFTQAASAVNTTLVSDKAVFVAKPDVQV